MQICILKLSFSGLSTTWTRGPGIITSSRANLISGVIRWAQELNLSTKCQQGLLSCQFPFSLLCIFVSTKRFCIRLIHEHKRPTIEVDNPKGCKADRDNLIMNMNMR